MISIDERYVRRTAQEFGIPEAVAEQMAQRLRPCIYLVPDGQLSRKEKGRPAGRAGGLPWLPKEVEWPDGRAPFALAIDCAALPGDVLDITLPTDGHLLFFIDFNYSTADSSAVLHVAPDADTTERLATYEVNGERRETHVYEPCTLYPVVGQTVAHNWYDGPEVDAFLESGGDDMLLDEFKVAFLSGIHGEPFAGAIQIGGYSNPWQMPPAQGDCTLLAQMQGDVFKYANPFLNLIVGTGEEISARRFDALRFEQQC
ncbi:MULTISPECIES: DUF1963 domain-containing protein [Streptomyces]|uniref:DUF1963 domain-containing protein n=1 Tax=Streptomyces TaxID=1883 RepID=UPI0033C2545E